MSGGKGGSSSTKVEIPPYAEAAIKKALGRADRLGQVGYMPYYGPDVAAFSPLQEQAFQGQYDAAAAMGLVAPGERPSGMPEAQEFAGGIRGYSSGDLFEQARNEFALRNPLQAEAFNKEFIAYGTEDTNPDFPKLPGDGARPPGMTDEQYQAYLNLMRYGMPFGR